MAKIAKVDNKTYNAHKTELKNIVRKNGVLYTTSSKKFMKVTIKDDIEQLESDTIAGVTEVKGIIYMDILDGVDESNPSARAFKILGLALHLAGDVYAHRTRVPLSSIDDGSYFPKNFDDFYIAYDFVLYHDTNKPYNSSTMNHYLRYKNNKSDICNCYYCFRTAISSGRVEFRDVANFHDGEGKYYEPDTLNFYGKRYTVGTANATNIIISRFLNNQDFSIYTFIPTDGGYTLRLNYLKGYIIGAGVDWDKLDSSLQERIESLSTIAEI